MRHAVVWGECDIVARFDDFVFGQAEGVPLDDFLGQCLGSCRGGFESREEGRGGGIGELGVEHILISLA